MSSVKLSDILTVSPSSTYIIKTDLQGYDCRAVSDLQLYNSDIFIPYIHMEIYLTSNSTRKACDKAVDILMDHGYIPFLPIQV